MDDIRTRHEEGMTRLLPTVCLEAKGETGSPKVNCCVCHDSLSNIFFSTVKNCLDIFTIRGKAIYNVVIFGS